MAVTRERFESGMGYEQYKESMTRNRERFDANERDLEISESDLEPFHKLPNRLNVLVLAEDWCGDVIANMPILGRIAQEVDTLNLRVFPRDQNLDIMDLYLNHGQYKSIPTFVFFDEDFNELGKWIERPDSVTQLRAEKRKEIYERNAEFGSPDAPVDQLPEDVRNRLNQATMKMREETAPFANREVVRELKELVDGIGARV